MRLVRHVFAGVLLIAVNGCSGEQDTVVPSSPEITPRLDANPGYMTEAEWIALGSPSSADELVLSIALAFNSRADTLTASGTLFWGGYTNEHMADLTAKIHKNGTQVGTLGHSHDSLAFLVPLGTGSQTYTVRARNTEATCGTTGSGSLIGFAGLKVWNPVSPVYVWSRTLTKDAPACPKARMKHKASNDTEENSTYAGYRQPSSVTVTNVSDVVGSGTCSWSIDGGLFTSTSCSSWTPS